MLKRTLADFACPGSEYRGAPFWAWNGKLEPEELRRQIRLMKRMGLGGFFMHSRVGLATPYLSEEWFDNVKACVDEAEKEGMRAWLYDEDRWPSGAAGGLVTKNPKYRQRFLEMTMVSSARKLEISDETIALFAARVNTTTYEVSDIVRLDQKEKSRRLPKGAVFLRFDAKTMEPRSWYNGQTYLDTLNHEAVRKFIAVTHAAYRREIGDKFGGVVPGIFTDEPGYFPLRLRADEPTRFPWTEAFPEIFRKRYGYDPIARLPEIFLDLKGADNVRPRQNFFDCATFLFNDAFGRQIGEYCEKHNLLFTGHLMCEDTPLGQTMFSGSATRFYEHMQAPGIDQLTEKNKLYDTAKQLGSAAHQFGKKWRLSETYGCTGWDFPFAGHKAIGDWQTALGVNLRCQHLAWYTMEGEAKRDYPASIFYQSPWHERYRMVEDYFARINRVMIEGEEVRDLLVIHPVESVWSLVRVGGGEADPRVKKVKDDLVRTRDILLTNQLDFDYGDEDILARHGKVSGRRLTVGRATYNAVLVPPCRTLRGSTLALLKKFRKAGGDVFFAEQAPEMVDATLSDAAAKFGETCGVLPFEAAAIVKAVEKSCRRIAIRDEKGNAVAPALYLLREDAECLRLFICNTSDIIDEVNPSDTVLANGTLWVDERTAAFDAVTIDIKTDAAGAPMELDPIAGKYYAARAKKTKDGWRLQTDLPALASRLFVIPRAPGKTTLPLSPALKTTRRTTLNADKWDYSLGEANVLLLDRPAYRLGDGKWRGPEEILRIDNAVRESMDVPVRGGNMVQPWAREKNPTPRTAPVTLRYAFDVETLPRGPVSLALENPAAFVVRLNGRTVDTDLENGWWVDRSLRTLPLPSAALKTGRNELELSLNYSEDFAGLEIVYLLGEFGVKLRKNTEPVMTALPARLKIGDWTKQGLPFYSGPVLYRTTFRPTATRGKRTLLRLPGLKAVVARVLVDGSEVGHIAWPPYELDLTDAFAGKTEVTLTIEVFGDRRNSHGPLHLKEKRPRWVGPAQFRAPDDKWRDDYGLVARGLTAPPELVFGTPS